MPLRKRGAFIPTALLTFAAAGVVPSAAHASLADLLKPLTTATSTGCKQPATTKAFAKVDTKDTADYSLAPGGGFEASNGWTLANGAKIVAGNENIGVTTGSSALQLPVGGTATSPAFCVDTTNPSFRFVSKLSGVDGGYQAVVLYRDSAGKLAQAQFTSSSAGGLINPVSWWNPSVISPLATKIPLLDNNKKTASAQIMFVGTTTALGKLVASQAWIDSVMVDPYRRG